VFFFQPLVGEVVVDDSEADEGGAVRGRGVPGADGPVVARAVDLDGPPAAVEAVGDGRPGQRCQQGVFGYRPPGVALVFEQQLGAGSVEDDVLADACPHALGEGL
jgi:hypothetical protein